MDLGGRAFDHHRRNGGRGICQQKLPAGPGIWTIFLNARGGDARGWNWLAYKGVEMSLFDYSIKEQILVVFNLSKER